MIFLCLAVAVAVLLGANVCIGSVSIPLKEVLSILGEGSGSSVSAGIVLEIRLPRALAAAILGGGLAYLAEWGLYSLISSKLISGLAGSFISIVPFSTMALPILAVYMATGILVGVFGGVNAIRNYLKV